MPKLGDKGTFTYTDSGVTLTGEVVGASQEADLAHSYIWLKDADEVTTPIMFSEGTWAPAA